MTTEPQDAGTPPTEEVHDASRNGFPIIIYFIAALSIIAIWYYAINRHFHLQSTKRENVAASFVEEFESFYGELARASRIAAATSPFANLARQTGQSPATPTEGAASTLAMMTTLSEAECIVVADNEGNTITGSCREKKPPFHNATLPERIARPGGAMQSGVWHLTAPHDPKGHLVIAPGQLPDADGGTRWLALVFSIDDALRRVGRTSDLIALVDREGRTLFASMGLPATEMFKDRISAGIWGNEQRGPRRRVVQYDSRLEFGYALLPGGDIAAIAPIPGAMDDYLLLGAMLTVAVVVSIPIMLRIHAGRERARQEEKRLRFYVAEIEKAKKEAERANRSKSEFLANISHEIRTLMNGVTGMLDLLSRTRLSEKQREYCDIIKGSTNSLLGIINDVLDFTKIEAGKMGIEEAPFDLQATAIECLRLLSSRAEERGNELIFDYQLGLPTHVVGDMVRLRQLITNLVSNAIKFTENGTIILAINGSPLENGRTRYAISVKDTGVGIEPEMQSRIFEKFEQGSVSIARKFGGSGLGLAICKRLTTLMGGEISCTSAVGQGSTFTITLPLLRGMRDNSDNREQRQDDWAGIKAIVYEPNDSLRDVVCRMLDSLGFEAAGTGDANAVPQLASPSQSAPEPLVIIANRDSEHTMGMIRAVKAVAGGSRSVIIVTSYPGAAEELPRPEPGSSHDLLLYKPLWRMQLYQAIGQTYHASNATTNPETDTRIREREAKVGVGVRILLAEDNLVNQKVATGILKKYGYEIDTAENGLEALQMVHDNHYDVVLMDCQMPEMDGFEATRKIREMEKASGNRFRHVIIALTADVLASDRENCLASGMDSHVAKPIIPEELVRTIQAYVPGR